MSAPTVAVQPVVNWPRSARSGQRYLVTVDVVLAEPIEWLYDREEFIVGCLLEGGDAFTIEALGSTSVVLHRFGGTYGPVRFAARADRDPAADGSDMLRLTLVTEGGLPFQPLQLPVLPEGCDPSRAIAAYAQWTMTAHGRSTSVRIATHQTIAGSEPQMRPTARKTALLIGVNRDILLGPGNAVEAMAAALSRYGFTVSRLMGADATRDGIFAAFERITADVGPDDAVFIFFSGPGGVFTVPAPDTSDRPNSPSHLFVPFVEPIDFGDIEGFGGITSIEIAALLARLTRRTRNVVAAYDCSYGAAPAHLVAGALGGSDDASGASVLSLDAAARHITTLHRNGVPLFGPGNPDVVELRGCSPRESAHEVTTADGRTVGAFSEALGGALEDAAGLQVTWATLFDHVRRRMIRTVGREQHPMVSGPALRLLFSTSIADQEASLPIVAESPNRIRILGAALLGVQSGDEFAIIPAGATGPDDVVRIGDAFVEEVVATEARARLDLRSPATTLPTNARAYRVKAMAPLLPVTLSPHPDLDEIRTAISASPLLRLADDDEPSEYEVRIDDAGEVTIYDRIGPLSAPTPAIAAHPIVTYLARLARAAALRELADDPRWTLENNLTVEWGTVVDGRQDPNPLSGGTVHVGQPVYIRVRNDGTKPIYVSLVDIGVAATVTVLTNFAPSGVLLRPGAEYIFGFDEYAGELTGVDVAWPQDLDPSYARPETVMVLATSQPLDVDILEQAGVRGVPIRDRSPIEQRLAQAATGSPRYAPRNTEAAVRYAVRSIEFYLDPHPAQGGDEHSVDAAGFDVRSPDGLRALCMSFRTEPTRHTDDGLIRQIKSVVDEYRTYFAGRQEQAPFAPFDELLPLMGWLIYEATWDAVQTIPATFNEHAATAEQLERGEAALHRIRELADIARALPWPQFAPRALGAIRAQALAESKRDTEAGYDAAWIAHQEARRRHGEYLDFHERGAARERFVRDFDEVLLQLDLAETGTACRTAERVISRWAEEFAGESERRWIERMFRELTSGVAVGEHAIETGRRIQAKYGLVEEVTEERLTLRSALQNPAIMTARAAELLLALGPEMRRLHAEAVGFATWEDWEKHVLGQFEKAYQTIEDPVMADGRPVVLLSDLPWQVIHRRMNLALLKPGYFLPSRLSFDPCLRYETLDAEALEHLTAYLAGPEGTLRQERGIGAATMPSFIRSVIACRSQGPEDRGYEQWREKWFRFDRYANEPGRRERVEQALAAAR